jgi:hypothetical protein
LLLGAAHKAEAKLVHRVGGTAERLNLRDRIISIRKGLKVFHPDSGKPAGVITVKVVSSSNNTITPLARGITPGRPGTAGSIVSMKMTLPGPIPARGG